MMATYPYAGCSRAVLALGISTLVATSVSAAEEPPRAAVGAQATGFVVGASLWVAPLDEDVLREELTIGFKVEGLLLGVNMYYASHTRDYKPEVGSRKEDEETFVVSPGAQFVLGRTKNARFELLGLLGAGVGTWRQSNRVVPSFQRGDEAPPEPTVSAGNGPRVRWYVGTGGRAWFYPTFGLNLGAGLLGDYRLQKGTFREPPVTLFLQAGAIGVF
ncbi:hypothetical protein [Polyangium sorediatum]|uniref:Outer membrane protein beta-barrel domain-containing protein n=1 Tax=Polyangium sorediatum TaxID=889274 RepID=A0ABT6NVY5_9BACT|nr:hypothetical protein [Polyangium sorediatum]MDI1432494.1 hypothetical protein [Polyangium sorediatum]